VLYMKALEVVRIGDESLETFAVAMRNLDRTKREIIEESKRNQVPGKSDDISANNGKNHMGGNTNYPRGFAEPIKESGVNPQAPPNDDDEQALHHVTPVGDRYTAAAECDPIQPSSNNATYKTPESRPSRGRPATRRMQSRNERAKTKEKPKCAICGDEDHDMSKCPAMDVEMPEENIEPVCSPIHTRQSANEGSLDPDVGRNLNGDDLMSKGKTTSQPYSGSSKPPAAKRRCKLCGEEGHYQPKCPLRDTPRAPVASPVCSKCGLSGHVKTTCGRPSSYKKGE
jgi:hypothetical protein